jgi:hypothetical protein
MLPHDFIYYFCGTFRPTLTIQASNLHENCKNVGCKDTHEIMYIQKQRVWSAEVQFRFFRETGTQWLRDLRHEMSSLAGTLESWVRIPLEAWMSVSVYSVCVVLCVDNGLATGWSLVQGVLLTACRLRNWTNGQGPIKDCRAIDR